MAKNIEHKVEYLGFGQANFSQCWYAAYQMALRFKSRNIGEVDDNLKSVLNLPDAKTNGLLVTDYPKAAKALGFEVIDTAVFRKPRGFWDVGLSDRVEAFLEHLEKNPLWVSRYSSKGVYHISVAYGFNEKDSRILYNNPFPGAQHARQVDMDSDIYVRHITAQNGSVQMLP